MAFTNTDTVRHDVRSFATAPDGRSSFASDVIGPTRSSIVFGASELEPGLYRFYCTLHPAAPDGTGMSGLLRVAPAGVR